MAEETRPPSWHVDLFCAVMLGVAAVATAWGSYQATRWSGVQAQHYTEANGLRIEATRAANEAAERRAIDVSMFFEWMNAQALGRQEIAAFYRQRFRAEFAPVFDEWLNLVDGRRAAPPTPFTLPAYQAHIAADAERLEHEAGNVFQQGAEANEIADRYVSVAIIFSMVMFFAGIAPQFKVKPVRRALMVLAGVVCVAGIVVLARYPVQ